MAFGGLNVNFGKLNKRKVLGTIIGVAEALLEDKSPEDDMAKTMSKKVMRDPEVEFLLRSFTTRYNLHGADIRVAPVVEEGTIVISSWNLTVNGKIAMKATGFEELTRQITESVLAKDPETIQKVVSTLETCLKG